MISHQDSFASLVAELDSKFNIWIAETKEFKTIVIDEDKKQIEQKTSKERSKIIERIIHICGDNNGEKYKQREYQLGKLIQQSLKSFDAREQKYLQDEKGPTKSAKQKYNEEKTRTIRLLTEDCPLELTPLIGITDNEVEAKDLPALDWRATTLEKKPLKENSLESNIFKVIATDTQCSMFIKNNAGPKGACIGPIVAAKVLTQAESKALLNTTAILEYVSLCHVLELYPLLLDLDFDFFHINEDLSLSQQIKYLIANAEDFLKTPNGIEILNLFGAKALGYRFYDFNQLMKIIRTKPNNRTVLEGYGRILLFITLDALNDHYDLFLTALSNPEKMKELLFRCPGLIGAIQQGNNTQFIKDHLRQPLLELLQNVQHSEKQIICQIISMLLQTEALTQGEWLQVINKNQSSSELYQWMCQRYIEKYLAQYRTFEQWLISVEPKDQVELFHFLEAQGKSLNYFTLYSMSPTLKSLPTIQSRITSYRETALQQIQMRYLFEEWDQKLLEEEKNCFKAAPPQIAPMDDQKINIVTVELDDYQKKYLWVDKKGHATSGMLTPTERASVYNQVMPILKEKTVPPDTLQKTLLDPKFKISLGSHSFYSMRPLTLMTPLMEWAENRRQTQDELKKYWEKRADICRQVKDNDILLLELLLDINVLDRLIQDELVILFDQGNKALFAEIMVRAYPGRPFTPFIWLNRTVDIDFLKKLVPFDESIDELNRVNQVRAELKIPQSIPKDAKYPGVNPGDAVLDKKQLYQLQDQDIRVGEEILYDQFKKIMIPIEFYNVPLKEVKDKKALKIVTQLAQKTVEEYVGIRFKTELSPKVKLEEKTFDRKIEVKEDHVLKNIYLVPMNSAQSVLINPEKKVHPHRQTYLKFKAIIQYTVDSLPSTEAMIAGVCNLNANHYVPYFIYRDKKGQIFVITIDPSPETSADLAACFKDIFPKCIYNDPGIAQQVRQRDCGFNALESIRVVAEKLHTTNPVLSVVKDAFQINPRELTVNGEPFKRFDYQKNKPYFLKEFTQQGEENRERWAALFRKKTQVRYSAEHVLEYSYDRNVEGQQAGDELDGVYSIIAALMIRDQLLEQYRQQYITKLELPTAQQLEKIRQHLLATGELQKEALEGEAPYDAIYAICKINFKQHTKDGLINIFKNIFLPRCHLNKDSNPEILLSDFKQTDKYIEFHKLLSEMELADFRRQALITAEAQIKARIFKLKEQFIYEYIHKNIEILLKNIQVLPDKTIEAIIATMLADKGTQDDLKLVLSEQKSVKALENHINSEVKTFVASRVDEHWRTLEQHPEDLRSDEIFDHKKEVLNIYALEHKKNVVPLKVSEEEEKTTYYVLVENEFTRRYHTAYMKKVADSLDEFVNFVLNHPHNLAYVKKLRSIEQIELSQRTDFLDIFFTMAKSINAALPTNPKHAIFHGKTLNYYIQLRAKTHFVKISYDRYRDRYFKLKQNTTFAELKEQKNHDYFTQLGELCSQKDFQLVEGETLNNFQMLYISHYANDVEKAHQSFNLLSSQLDNLKYIFEFCQKFNLFPIEKLKFYHDQYEMLLSQSTQLMNLSLVEFATEAQYLISYLKLTLDKMLVELYQDSHYVPGSVEPGSYTYYVQHLFCSLFNLPAVKQLLLTARESYALDPEFKQRMGQFDFYNVLVDPAPYLLNKIETKTLPSTYGRPLTWRMVSECLHFWRAHRLHRHPMQSDDGLDNRYFKLLEEFNGILVADLDKEISADVIKRIKTIFDVRDDMSTHFQTWIINQPKSSVNLAVGALLNSKSFSPDAFPYEKRSSAALKENLGFKHLKLLMGLHHGKQKMSDLPGSTAELLRDLKLDEVKVVADYSLFSSPEALFLQSVITAIQTRHTDMKKEDFILDYTDIQILKKSLSRYVSSYRHQHDFLDLEKNRPIDNIFVILAAFIQVNTPDATPVARLLIPDIILAPSLERYPLTQLAKQDGFLISKESVDFYQDLKREAKRVVDPEKLLNVVTFINLMSQFDQLNPNLSSSTYPIKMCKQFKECVAKAKTLGQLAQLFEMISSKDKSTDEMVKDLVAWSDQLMSHLQLRREKNLFCLD